MYHYSARQALMEAKRQELMNQAARAKAVREARAARGRRNLWFARSKVVSPAVPEPAPPPRPPARPPVRPPARPPARPTVPPPARPPVRPKPVAEHHDEPQHVRGFEAAPPRPAEHAL